MLLSFSEPGTPNAKTVPRHGADAEAVYLSFRDFRVLKNCLTIDSVGFPTAARIGRE